MFKHLKFAAIALLAGAAFTACSDDDPKPLPTPQAGEQGAYVINQGNQYGGVAGTVTAVSFNPWQAGTADAFAAANSQSLGDTPQAPHRYGSRIYIPVYGSNRLWVLDAQTLRIIKAIDTNEPEAVCSGEGYVFVANNDGYVTRIDTATYAQTRVAVGPNPASLAYADGQVFVSISDGYNYANGYANGKKVAVVSASQATLLRNVTTGTNPGQIVATPTGTLFLVARGNYADEAARIQTFSANDAAARDLCPGQLIALSPKADRLYVIDYTADYASNTSTVSSSAYATATLQPVASWQLDAAHLPAMPQAIDVNPANGDLYVCSDDGPNGYASLGFVLVYNAQGTWQHTLNAGIHPFGVAFK